MKKIILILTLIVSAGAFAQVGINTENPDATLDVRGDNHVDATNTPGVVATGDGVLVPRVTDTDMSTAAPGNSDGQLVYNTGDKTFYFWNAATPAWEAIGGGAPAAVTPVRRVTTNTTITNADFGGVILCEGGSTVFWPPVSATFTPSTGVTVTLTAYSTGSVSNDFSDPNVNRFGNSNPANSDGAVTFIYFDNGVPAETGWYNIDAL
jgi:hypothetical protein